MTRSKKVTKIRSRTPSKQRGKVFRQSSPKETAKIKKILKLYLKRIRARMNGFLARRPHRSFRLTARRDYKRSLNLPGYVAFTIYVYRILSRRRGLFLLVAMLYGSASVVFGGLSSQQMYNQIASLLNEGSAELFGGGVSKIGQAGMLSLSAFSGANKITSDVQQLYVGLILLLTWLTTVWLLRHILADTKPKLRDGLYNSCAPFISTLLVAIILLVQILPVGLLAIAYSGLTQVGVLENGFGMVMFWALAIVIISLSLYWAVSTFIALIIVTVPGTYPMFAVKAAGDVVIGRRLRILYRLLWLAAMIVIVWFAVMIPIILLVNWLTGLWHWLSVVPIVPVVASILTALTAVWVCGYIYLLYRRIIDDETAPA